MEYLRTLLRINATDDAISFLCQVHRVQFSLRDIGVGKLDTAL